MIVLKLGGSVVTDKDRPETVDRDALEGASETIGAALERGGYSETGSEADHETEVAGLVVVHGGGSFGHHHASEHGVDTTNGSRDVRAVRDVHGAMKRLNDAVVGALVERGVPAVPVHPFSVGSRSAEGALALPLDGIETMLGEGFVPVLHGDLIVHADRGVTVVSGDELVAELATGLDADRIGLCSTVPGVLDGSGAVIDRISAYETVENALGGSESTDVTGGMAAKVRALLDLESAASIFGLEGLDAFLAGENPGTTIG